jgi:hypothetical protein
MHRTLKEETTKPAALTLRLQQKKFDRFRQVFNYERPHEGLNNATPGSIYQPSSMTLPRNLIEYVYPKGSELRRPSKPVPANGAPLSVLILEGIPYSRIAASQTALT